MGWFGSFVALFLETPMFLAQSGNSQTPTPTHRGGKQISTFIFHDFAPSELGSASRNPTSIFIHQVAETWERWFGIGEDLSWSYVYIDICMYLDYILSTYFLLSIDAKNWTQKFHPITLAHGHENPFLLDKFIGPRVVSLRIPSTLPPWTLWRWIDCAMSRHTTHTWAKLKKNKHGSFKPEQWDL